MTQAKVVDGTIYILQHDGSWQESRSESDWSKFDALTEDDMRRFAEEDGEADCFDQEIDSDSYRIRRPAKPDEAA